MKKFLLSICFALSLAYANAQVCTPDNTCLTGICPDTIINLPDAYINTQYNTPMTIVVPPDTAFVVQGQAVTFKFDSANFENYDQPGDINLPSNLTASCENSNNIYKPCMFYGNTSDCMLLAGNVTTNIADTGMYDLTVKVRAYLTCLSPTLACSFFPKLDTLIIFYGYHINVKCFGVNTSSTPDSAAAGNQGTATASTVGQSGPTYTFAWSNGATTQTITGLAAGTYYVTATASNGCTDVDSAIVAALTGTIENADHQFDVSQNSPNPFSRITNISFTNNVQQMISFKVYNILGDIVYSEDFVGNSGRNSFHYSAKNLPAGVYSYSLSNGKKTVSKRMILLEE